MKNATPPPAENTRYGYKNNEGHRLHVSTVGADRDHVELAIAGVGDLDWRSLNIPAAEVPGIALAILTAAGVTPESEHYGLVDDPARSLRVAAHYLALFGAQTAAEATKKELAKRRDELALELDGDDVATYEGTCTGVRRSIDMIIRLQDEAAK